MSLHPITVALYTRVSSDQQADKDISIPSQRKLLQEYAAKQGWTIVQEYSDEGESAKSDDRPGFQEMTGATHDKPLPFTKILVWKLSRFARNRYDSVVYKTTHSPRLPPVEAVRVRSRSTIATRSETCFRLVS